LISEENISTVREKYEALKVVLNERTARLWAATEANAIGRGGVRTVSRATGIAESTIRLGQGELYQGIDAGEEALKSTHIRQAGGGRKKKHVSDPQLLEALDALVEPTSRGDPISPLRWTCKSTRQLAEELKRQGHSVGSTTVGELLKESGYSLQANRKTLEGTNHPDRDAQFRSHQRTGQRVSEPWPAGNFCGHQEKGAGG
jgi:transposase